MCSVIGKFPGKKVKGVGVARGFDAHFSDHAHELLAGAQALVGGRPR